MQPVVSCIIASHQEKPYHLAETVKSIRSTAGGAWIEIIVVDDCSTIPVTAPGCTVIRNNTRLGVGQSRHKGVEAATASYIVITDSHTVFHDGWLTPLLDVLHGGGERILICGQMDALGESGDKVIGRYWGGRMVFFDPSSEEPRWRVLCAKWAKEKPAPYHPISAVMGACYAMRKDWFLKIGGLKMLRSFGGDEESLSMKTLLGGGEIRLFKLWRIGHRFRNGNPPYRIIVDECVYNTMMLALTCCPPDVAKDLIAKIGPGVEVVNAKEMVRVNREAIDAERVRLQGVFTRSWDEYVKLVNAIG